MSKIETLNGFDSILEDVRKYWNKTFLLQLDCKVIGLQGLVNALGRDGLYLLFRSYLRADNCPNSLLSLTGSQVFKVRGHKVKFMAR